MRQKLSKSNHDIGMDSLLKRFENDNLNKTYCHSYKISFFLWARSKSIKLNEGKERGPKREFQNQAFIYVNVSI